MIKKVEEINLYTNVAALVKMTMHIWHQSIGPQKNVNGIRTIGVHTKDDI